MDCVGLVSLAKWPRGQPPRRLYLGAPEPGDEQEGAWPREQPDDVGTKATAAADLPGRLNTGIIREPHSEWSTTPSRQVRETRRKRSGKVPTQPIRSRPHPIRNDRGSCQQRDLPSNAPSLSWCRAGAFHLQAPAEVPAALSSAFQDATRRSPGVIRSSHQDDRTAPYERAPRQFRQG